MGEKRTSSEVVVLIYARRSCYPNPIDLYTSCMPKKVYVRCQPATVVPATEPKISECVNTHTEDLVQLPEIVRRLVVSSDDDSQYWRGLLSGIISRR